MRRGRATARRAAATVALGYTAAAALWILLSDRVLVSLGLPHAIEAAVGSVKGLLFVLVTASMLYVLLQRRLEQLATAEERYRGLFDHATESLILFCVHRDERGEVRDLVVEDANPVLLERVGAPRGHVVGCRSSARESVPERLCPYFDFLSETVATGNAQRRDLHDESIDTYTTVVAYPIDESTWTVAGVDVTDTRRAQLALREGEERIRQAYVDVLDAVTGGKLVLITEAELGGYLGEPLADGWPIDSMARLAEARENVRHVLGSAFPKADPNALLSALGEALNNVLKHAERGTYRLYRRDGAVQVEVTDEGPGIDFRNLPKATLLPGYSTTATLGMGFTIMLQLCDRVLLSTRPGRTIVVLEIVLVREPMALGATSSSIKDPSPRDGSPAPSL